jgi:hypothetical protein
MKTRESEAEDKRGDFRCGRWARLTMWLVKVEAGIEKMSKMSA